MRLSDVHRCACKTCGPRPAPAAMRALLYHSYGDVAAEKIRINAVVSQTVAAWNACSDSATDATGQQLSTDFNAWYTTWVDWTNNGTENYANLPDNDDWDITQTYETQLQALTARINAYCGSGLPGPAPTGKSPTNPLQILSAVAISIAVAVVATEIAPLIPVIGVALKDAVDGLSDLVDDVLD
jgi:hypothetical protein